jgi:hypothetical protein
MKIVAFLVGLILFVGSFLLFGYAFSVPVAVAPWMFFSGIVAICAALALPFHWLGKTD